MVQQLARPNQDVASNGTWTFTPSPPITLHEHLNERTSDDTSYVTTPSSGRGWFEVALDRAAMPIEAVGGTLQVRYSGIGFVELPQGAAAIFRWNVGPAGSLTTETLTVTAAQLATVTNFSDLRVRVTVTSRPGGSCATAGPEVARRFFGTGSISAGQEPGISAPSWPTGACIWGTTAC